jgi:hypothetical protein
VSLPNWHLKSDDELREIVRGVWEGRVVGTWQLERYRELDQAFPGFDSLQCLKAAEGAGLDVYSSTPDAALALARLPLPIAAYGHRTKVSPDAPKVPQTRPPVFQTWEILSSEEWVRLREFLAYPPR